MTSSLPTFLMPVRYKSMANIIQYRHSERADRFGGISEEMSRCPPMPLRATARLTRHDGFSLVELSIVLVILGLLTGGILTGQNLIRAAELRKLVTDFNVYRTAVHTFRDKYFALPGDMANATDFWGIAAGSTGNDFTCYNSESTTATCNGNNDGMLPCQSDADQCNETGRAAQHLGLSGLLPGSYNGKIYGTALPKQYYISSFDALMNFRTITPTYTVPNLQRLGILYRTTDGTGILIPEEAWNIDTKIDDGDADRGEFLAKNQVAGTAVSGCVSGAVTVTDDSANYELTSTNSDCTPVFLMR